MSFDSTKIQLSIAYSSLFVFSQVIDCWNSIFYWNCYSFVCRNPFLERFLRFLHTQEWHNSKYFNRILNIS